MKQQHGAVVMVGVLAALVTSGMMAVGAQAPAGRTPKAGWTPARLPDGQPDMQGTYISGWTAPIERYTQAEREAWNEQMLKERGPSPGAYELQWTELDLRKGQYRPPAGTVQVVDLPDGRIPWQPWALAKKNYIRDHPYERPEFLDSRVRCLPAGPRLTLLGGYNGWQVLQPPGKVVIFQEHTHNYRVIHLDGRHPDPRIQLWMGDSRGRWEGHTLVVDVANFTDKTWVVGEDGGEGMSAGSFHSPALRMTERFTLIDENDIDYEATFEDPQVFARPWTIRFGVWVRAPEGYENYEYACHEGNRAVELTKPLFKKP